MRRFIKITSLSIATLCLTACEFPTANPDEDQGLIFIALNASISRQFEFIQRQWVNFGTNLLNELGIRDMYASRNFSRTVDTTPPRVIGLELRMRFGTWERATPMDRSSNLPQN